MLRFAMRPILRSPECDRDANAERILVHLYLGICKTTRELPFRRRAILPHILI
jgi:hypothetical protein